MCFFVRPFLVRPGPYIPVQDKYRFSMPAPDLVKMAEPSTWNNKKVRKEACLFRACYHTVFGVCGRNKIRDESIHLNGTGWTDGFYGPYMQLLSVSAASTLLQERAGPVE